MESTTTLPPVYDQVKNYIETKVKLWKLEGIDKSSAIISEIITDTIISLLSVITFIFFSITLALVAAYLLHSAWQGFGCVTLLYAVISLSARILKAHLQNFFVRKFIQKIFK